MENEKMTKEELAQLDLEISELKDGCKKIKEQIIAFEQAGQWGAWNASLDNLSDMESRLSMLQARKQHESL